jgi:hypothetical protein
MILSRNLSPPEKLDDLDETEQTKVKELCLVQCHYVKNTEECNEFHYGP